MREIMHLAHEFLQHFCRNNSTNQTLLHRHIDLFFQSGDSVSGSACFKLEDASKTAHLHGIVTSYSTSGNTDASRAVATMYTLN